MPKSRLSAFLSLLVVFLSGALVGAFAYRLAAVNTVLTSNGARPPRPDPEEIRKHMDAEMRDRVKLDDDQISKFNKILDETHDEFDQIHKRANDETRAQQRLQDLMNKREQMFEMLSNFTKATDEMAKCAIGNIK